MNRGQKENLERTEVKPTRREALYRKRKRFSKWSMTLALLYFLLTAVTIIAEGEASIVSSSLTICGVVMLGVHYLIESITPDN